MRMNKPGLLYCAVNVKITNFAARVAPHFVYTVAQAGYVIDLLGFLFLLLLFVSVSVHLDTVGRIKQKVNCRFL